ncbi:MAG: COX15/CtaA family protein [Gammaproteobacteria bacterium]|nr:COX15/CtaA family protein [Gammaproteobacteria bacterium]
MTTLSSSSPNKPLAVWLFVCCALIFAMVVLGGVTRLTRSGLSIVEWDPIMGALPPLNQAQWDSAFNKYKQTPEYRKVNRGMPLPEFKKIFYVEWSHRLLGRLIGVVFLVPFFYFLFRRRITRELVPKLVTMFILGGLQGAMGWYMVKSGLVDIPRVSPYRLTAHLAFAVIIYAYLFWVALGLWQARAQALPALAGLRRFATMVTALIFLMIVSGGFVAGNKAGFVFNSFPLMNGHFFPEGLWALQPWWINLFENVATVQFDHRLIAYLLSIVIPIFAWTAIRYPLSPPARRAVYFLLAWLMVQITLGIATLLYIVPIPLAAAHQAGALILFSLAIGVNHQLRVR